MKWYQLKEELRSYFESKFDKGYGEFITSQDLSELTNWLKDNLKPKNRSTKANSLYWLWMECLEDNSGQSKNDFHDYFKDKFIGYSIKEFNERSIIKEPSTKGMLKAKFHQYMVKVKAEAATEFNTVVPLPEDQGYDQFIEHYKNYI